MIVIHLRYRVIHNSGEHGEPTLFVPANASDVSLYIFLTSWVTNKRIAMEGSMIENFFPGFLCYSKVPNILCLLTN